MDPVSIAGLVGPTLRTLYAVTTTLYTFITSAKKVDKSLENLQVDLRSLTRVLEDIETFLKDVAPGTEGAWEPIYNAIQDTRRTINDLQKILDRLGPSSEVTNAFKKTVKQVQLNLNSDEINNIRSRIQWHSIVLQTALQTATLTINCLTNDNLINVVNPKIDSILTLLPRLESMIKQFHIFSSQMTAKFDKLPKDFQNSYVTEYSQQLKHTAEAAIVTASTIISSHSTIVGGKDRNQPSSSSSGALLEYLRKRNIEEWFSHLTVGHEEWELGYDTLSELKPDDSVSSIGLERNKRSQQIDEAAMPRVSSGASKRAGTPTNTSMGRTDSTNDISEEAFPHLSHKKGVPSSRKSFGWSSEEDFQSDTISEITLSEHRTDHKVDSSYDEKSAKELLAVLGTNFEATEWKVNDSLLDLAKMTAGQGVKSISNIVGTLLYLLEKGANINAMDAGSNTPLHHASMAGNIAVVEQLIERNADLNIQDERGRTALHIAASKGHTPVVGILLKSGVDVEQKNEKDWNTALLCAARSGSTSTVECLLKAGASVDVRNDRASTPLLLASRGDYVEVVEALLKAGASIDVRNDRASTPLLLASRGGYVEVVEALLKAGASTDVRYRRKSTPLLRACDEGHVKVVETLLKAGALIDISGDEGWTPLLCASERGHIEVVKTLLKAGAKLNTKTEAGRTSLMRSAYLGHKTITELLLAAGADMSARSKDGTTVLHSVLWKHFENCLPYKCAFCAGSVKRQDMVKLLCEKGADLSARDDVGYSPLSLLYWGGAFSKSEQKALAKVLKKYGAH